MEKQTDSSFIDQEIKAYDAWVNGEVYGIMLFDKNEDVLGVSSGYIIPYENRIETLKDMLSAVGVNIQDEYQLATKEVIVSLK